MKVADTRASLILALKNDKNSARWEEFVNQYYDYLHYAAYQVDSETGRFRFVPDGVDPDEAVEQTFWQLKNIILPDVPQFDMDFTESQLERRASWRRRPGMDSSGRSSSSKKGRSSGTICCPS